MQNLAKVDENDWNNILNEQVKTDKNAEQVFITKNQIATKKTSNINWIL